MELTYEDNKLIEFFFDNNIFKKNFTTIELIIKPDCNQNCKYCYLTKFGDKIYPKELRVSNEITLKNIKLFLNYLIEKKTYVPRWELFAGDMFYDNLFFDIADLFLNYYKNIKKLYPNFYNNTQHSKNNKFLDFGFISFPCNCSFVEDEEKRKKFELYYELFKNEGIGVNISWSTDGPYGNIREENKIDYEMMFSFIEKYHFGMHPMISYETIDYAIDNYKWWTEQFEKHNFNPHRKDRYPGMLEVRNEGWTQEHIKKYLELLDYIVEDRFKCCYKIISDFAISLFASENFLEEYKTNNIYAYGPPALDPIKLYNSSKSFNCMPCTMGGILCLNCADLSFVPCHRLAYPQFKGAKFEIKNNKIIGIKALEGIYCYFNQILENVHMKPVCVSCKNKYFCMKGCNGAQFEAFGDPLLPIPEVCNLLDSKINFLVKKYHDLGLFHFLFRNANMKPNPDSNLILLNFEQKEYWLDLLKDKGYIEYEQYRNTN